MNENLYLIVEPLEEKYVDLKKISIPEAWINRFLPHIQNKDLIHGLNLYLYEYLLDSNIYEDILVNFTKFS